MGAFDQISKIIDSSLMNPGSYILAHEHIPLNKSFFRSIVPNSNNLVFVDGGSSVLFGSGGACVGFIRIASIFYSGSVRTKRVIDEFFVAIISKGNVHSVELFNHAGVKTKSFSFNDSLNEPSEILGKVRSHLEFEAVSIAVDSSSKGTVIVRDGDSEGSEFIKSKAIEKEVVVCALSKTSRLCTDTGVSAISALRMISPSGSWVYCASDSLVFCKFHPASKYIFRLDLISGSANSAVSALAYNADCASFLGYPYGLVDADRIAQVPVSESRSLKLKFALHSKERFGLLEHALDSHDVLNSLS